MACPLPAEERNSLRPLLAARRSIDFSKTLRAKFTQTLDADHTECPP
jgi:hypothetical protein